MVTHSFFFFMPMKIKNVVAIFFNPWAKNSANHGRFVYVYKQAFILYSTHPSFLCLRTSRGRLLDYNVIWKMPLIQLTDFSEVEVSHNNKQWATFIGSIPDSWNCSFNPVLSQGVHHLWNVKLSPQSERPRFMLIVFQNASTFQHCDLSDIKVHLNSDRYPYDDFSLKFDRNRYVICGNHNLFWYVKTLRK